MGLEGGADDQKQPSPPHEPPQHKTTSSSDNNKKRYPYSRGYGGSVYKYPYPRGYGGPATLHGYSVGNIGWAQGVQNKPLNDVLIEFDNNKKSEIVDDDNKEESDKEEGEIEEGEIDGDNASKDDNKDDNNNNNNNNNNNSNSNNNNNKKGSNLSSKVMEIEDGDLEIQVSSIRKVLENVTIAVANRSFDIVCARLRSSLESLRELVLHTWFPSKDDLIQQSFSALLCVYSVFCSMSSTLRDQNRDKMSRLLTFVMSLSSVLFSPDQRKEVEAMMATVTPPPPPVVPKPKPRERQEELPVADNKAILTDANTLSVNAGDNSTDSLKRVGLDSAAQQSDKQNSEALSNAVKKIPGNLNVRVGGFGPLLDLHKVHDEDSLPSPTSKTTPTLPFFGSAAPPRVVHGFNNPSRHPYETDALKAVSSYQQKFGRSSFLTQDRLPSPTPSEDGNEGGADDMSEEVSSFSTSNNNIVKNLNPSVLPQSTVSSVVHTSIPATQSLVSGVSAGPPSSAGTNLPSRATGRSRDPRLRHLSSNVGSVDLSFCPTPVVPGTTSSPEPPVDVMNPKKKPEGPVLDSPASKKQRIGLESIGSENSSSLGSLASRAFVGPATDPRKSIDGTVISVTSSVNTVVPASTVSQPVTNVSTIDPLQSLLKGITGDPAAWMNMFKEQQKVSEPLQNVSHPANSNSVRMQVSLPTSSPTISSGTGQTSVGSLQAPTQTAVTLQSPQKDPAKLRMKPRDPRRALQSTAAQKTGNHVSDPRKVNGVHNLTHQGVQENSSSIVPGTEANISPASYSLGPELPDIAKQFTTNLKNIADMISAPPTSSIQPSILMGSQSVLASSEKGSAVSGGQDSSPDQRILRPGEVVAGRPQSQNQWGDVEHLFEGYDAQQRAAIQQERARRMDEQKKMFDSRKLCLVLDLDHTLLNSAKFAEVDPRHDEILRKKEEHDREQSQRHLFRFPHMAMWTKLRPGIWNFLEKASKLYELHLYTMGNKLYATEMAKVLDPKGSLFSGRVISRGDDGEPVDGDDRAPKSKDLEGVLGMESAVVIIDDSVRVWPHNKLNLIVVERYLYFPCSRRHFGLSGPSLLDCDRDERPEDGTLACCLGVVEKIHQNFFANMSLDDLDVRNILASEQRKVLSGCRILFSRVFPVGEANPHLYPLWQTAEQFGAVCTNQIDEQVTHVVANAPGTDKVNWALSTGRFAVYPSWVEASAVLYRRANEPDFAIKP